MKGGVRSRGVWLRVPPIQMVVVLIIVVGRATLAALGDVAFSPDSVRYRNDADLLKVFRVDLAQGPGLLVQVIHFLPLQAAMAAQVAVAAGLWSWAAVVATRGMSQRWLWLFLASSLSPWWLAWDRAVLSESLTLAGMALFGAGLARWLLGSESSRPLLVGASVTLLSRPLTVPLVLAILLVVVVARRSVPRPRLASLALVLIVAGAGAQAVVFNHAQADYDYLSRPTSMSAIQASDRMAARHDHAGYLEAAADFGMPSCPIGEVDPGFAGSDHLRSLPCPEMIEWLNKGGLPWWAELVHLPIPTVVEIFAGEWVSDTWRDYFWGGHLLPTAVIAAVDIVMWTAMAGACVIIASRGAGHRVARLAVVLGVLGFAATMILVDGQENWRHMLPALVTLIPFGMGVLHRDSTCQDDFALQLEFVSTGRGDSLASRLHV